MTSQSDKAKAFRALHERPGAFVIPNPFDAGTARILAGLGFEALATTSAGCAFALGRPDGAITRDEALAHSSAHRRGDALAGVGRPRERLRGCAGRRRAHDRARRRGRARRLLDRGRDRAARRPDLRSAPCRPAHRRGGRGGEAARLPVHADRAGRELPARPTRPRRHHRAPAGLRGGGRRRALRAGAARGGRDPRGVRGGEQARERDHGPRRRGLLGRAAGGARRAPDQPRLGARARRARRVSARGRGGQPARHLHLRRARRLLQDDRGLHGAARSAEPQASRSRSGTGRASSGMVCRCASSAAAIASVRRSPKRRPQTWMPNGMPA